MGLIIGPFIILYFVIAYYLTRYAWRAAETPRKKYINSFSTFFVFVFLFTGDAMIGHGVLYVLCKTQGGVLVNQSILLDDSYFYKDGNLRLYSKKYRHEKLSIEDKYFGEVDLHADTWFPNMSKTTYKITNLNGEVLSKYSTFNYGGGWFNKLGSGGGGQCKGPFLLEKMLSSTFVKRKI